MPLATLRRRSRVESERVDTLAESASSDNGERRASTGDIVDWCANHLGSLGAVGIYLLLAFIAYWPESLFESNRAGASLDSIGQIWNLAWMSYALSHHVNPFFTTAENFPFGVNLADNAVGPLIGFVLWPLTVVAGAIATTNFAFVLAFASAATAMYFVARRMVRSRIAAFFAGLVYGFSPYMDGEGSGHVTLVFTFLFPIILYLLYDLFAIHAWPPRRLGVVVGVLLALQVFLAPELLADAALVVFLVVVLAAVKNYRRILSSLRYVIHSSVWVVGVFFVLAGYLIWYSMFGTNHISGSAQPIGGLNYHADLFSLVVPTFYMHFSPPFLNHVTPNFGQGNVSESGAYIGLPLLLVAIATVIVCRKRAEVRLVGLVGLVAFVFALGPKLDIDDHIQTITMPFRLLNFLPLVQSEVPGRYALFVQLSVALLLAFGLDRAFSFWRAFSQRRVAGATRTVAFRSRWRTRLGSLVIVGASVGFVFPLIPNLPFPSGPMSAPSFFTSRALSRIPPGSVVLAYPYPQPYLYYNAALWQAVSNFRFKVLGSYAIVPGGSTGTPWPPTLDPPEMQRLFDEGTYGVATPPSPFPVDIPVTRGVTTFAALRKFLVNYHVNAIVMQPIGTKPKFVIHFLSLFLGRPAQTGGMDVWFSVPERLARYEHRTNPGP